MKTEMGRMLSGKGFLWAVLLGSFGICLGTSFPKPGTILEPGSFISLEIDAFSSDVVNFLIPVVSVLPWSDSFLGECKGGFLKVCLLRTCRKDYAESKALTVALGGGLAWMAAGILVLGGYFIVFFPVEKPGNMILEKLINMCFLLLRLGLIGGALSSLGGIFGAVSGSVYMAYGLPFVSYYFCVILHDRYFPDVSWLYPLQWVNGSGQWGEHNKGLWLFLLLLFAGTVLIHREILLGQVEEI